MLHPPFFACLALRNGGASFSGCKMLAGRSGGRKQPSAHCIRKSPSVRSALAYSS